MVVVTVSAGVTHCALEKTGSAITPPKRPMINISRIQVIRPPSSILKFYDVKGVVDHL